MAEYIVAKIGDIPAGKGKLVFAGEKAIALFNVNGNFFAVENACPHAGGPLADGILDSYTIICPLHGWEFDIRTGESSYGANVQTFPVKADEKTGEIKVVMD